MDDKYENYQEFRVVAKQLMDEKKFDQVISLTLNHRELFLSYAHIILANAYILRANSNPNKVSRADVIESFRHIKLATLYSPDSVDLFLENDVDRPEDRFCERVSKEFIETNQKRLNIHLTKEEMSTIERDAKAFYEEHPAKSGHTCSW